MNAIEPLQTSNDLTRLIQAAAHHLTGATTAAEVLEARDKAAFAYDAAKRAARLAAAKGAHDDIIARVYRAQADALEIESLAKRRLADEYDAAQDRGEVVFRAWWRTKNAFPKRTRFCPSLLQSLA